MSKYTDSAQAVRNSAQQFKALSDASDLLDSLGSLDNAAAEIQAKYDKIVVDTATAQAALDALNHEHDVVNEDINKAVEDANANADKIVADAHASASSIVDAANAQAASIVTAAQAKADGIDSATNGLLDTQNAIVAENAALSAKTTDLLAAAAAAQAKLDAVKASIATLTGAAQ